MEVVRPAPRIVYVERVSQGVVIAFDDGQCALYSSSLLYEALNRAELLPEVDESDQ